MTYSTLAVYLCVLPVLVFVLSTFRFIQVRTYILKKNEFIVGPPIMVLIFIYFIAAIAFGLAFPGVFDSSRADFDLSYILIISISFFLSVCAALYFTLYLSRITIFDDRNILTHGLLTGSHSVRIEDVDWKGESGEFLILRGVTATGKRLYIPLRSKNAALLASRLSLKS